MTKKIERITSNEIETAIKKSLGPDRITAEFYQMVKEELIPTLLKHFREVTLP
jgi:hypothetical protein